MLELVRTNDLALLSALQAALAAEGIGCVEFDGAMAGVMGGMGMFERRLMVLEEDLSAAREVLRAIAPEYLEPK